MNIFIMTDMEGITGVDSADNVLVETEEHYISSCRKLTDDINAAVDGYFSAGARKVFVEDGHGSGKNFLPGTLDERAILVDGIKDYDRLTKSGEYSAMAMIGTHAMAGTENAFLDHTQSSTSWFDYTINGRSSGEIAQSAAFIGRYDIPIIMVSGDIAACEEAKRFLGDIATAPVKRAVGRNKAVSLKAEDARALIRQAAIDSMQLIGKIKPFKILLPAELRLILQRTDYCEGYCNHSGVEKVNSRTVRKYLKEINSYLDLML